MTIQHRWFITAALFIVVFWLALLTSNNINLLNYGIKLHRLKPEVNNNPNNDTLVDLNDFKYVMNNVSLCTDSMNAKEANQSAIAIIVHSARSNFENRYAIRNTWGSVKMFKGWHLHLTFLLGIDSSSDPKLESQLWDEYRQHGDMIMGNFVDSYRNLTYKHIMGYKWVTTFCPSAKYILKTDDDMYADIFQVVEVLLVELMLSEKTYICESISDSVPFRDVDIKWYVSKDEYTKDTYPDYCAGSAYLMTADGAEKIYATSNTTKFFWIDDVFVTGILREKYDLVIANNTSSSLQICTIYNQYINLDDSAKTLAWCKDGLVTGLLNRAFILIEHQENDSLISLMFCIWNKVRLLRFAINNAITPSTYC